MKTPSRKYLNEALTMNDRVKNQLIAQSREPVSMIGLLLEIDEKERETSGFCNVCVVFFFVLLAWIKGKVFYLRYLFRFFFIQSNISEPGSCWLGWSSAAMDTGFKIGMSMLYSFICTYCCKTKWLMNHVAKHNKISNNFMNLSYLIIYITLN